MVSAQRTSPTVKPLTTMNHRSIRNWELKFGVTQLVVLLGFVLGSISIAFVLGHHIGWEGGYQSSLASNVSNMVRFPIPEDQLEKEVRENVTSQVYAKLQEPEPGAGSAGSELHPGSGSAAGVGLEPDGEALRPIPELDTIKTTKAAPLTDMGVSEKRGVLSADSVFKKEAEKASQSGASIRVLGQSAGAGEKAKADSSATLGALLKEAGKDGKASEPKTGDAKAASALSVVVKEEQKPVEIAEKGRASVTVKEPLQTVATSKLSKGWYAQVAAPKAIKDAEELSDKLRKSGFEVSVERTQVKGEDYYRVLVGPEETKQLGDRLVSQLRREPYIKSEPFMRSVK